MAKDIFIFDGGPYKEGLDDGAIRVPLTCTELHKIMRDDQLPTSGSLDNSVHHRLVLNNLIGEIGPLSVGDRLYVMVLPDALGYRGILAMPETCLDGFEVTLQLVNACEVYQLLNDPNGDPADATTYGSALEVDYGVGLGDAMCDAEQKAQFAGGVWSDYRNPMALQGGYFQTPFIAGIGKALYMRMTIDEIPDLGGDCPGCQDDLKIPHMQIAAIVDDPGITTNIIQDRFCDTRGQMCPPGTCS